MPSLSDFSPGEVNMVSPAPSKGLSLSDLSPADVQVLSPAELPKKPFMEQASDAVSKAGSSLAAVPEVVEGGLASATQPTPAADAKGRLPDSAFDLSKAAGAGDIMPNPVRLGIVGSAALMGAAGAADTAVKGGSVGDVATSGVVNAGLGALGAGVAGKIASTISNSASGQAIGAAASKVASLAPAAAGMLGIGGHGMAAAAAGVVGAVPYAAAIVKAIGSDAAGVLESAGIKTSGLVGTPWLAQLGAAAKSGLQRVGVVHYLMSQQDPGYAQTQTDKPAE